MINLFFADFPDDTRYTSAVARVRALESKMLYQSTLIRLLKTNGTAEMLKVLMDTYYNRCLHESEDRAFEKALDNELQESLKLIHAIDPDPVWTDMWRWRYDAHNIKVMLKSAYTEKGLPEYLIPYGIIEPKSLFDAINENNLLRLPSSLKNAVESIKGDNGVQMGTDNIDLMIDRSLYSYFIKKANGSKNIFLIHLTQMLIDFINIRAFLRIKRIKTLGKLFHKAFIYGGKIKKEQFITQEDKDSEEFIKSIIEKGLYKELKGYINMNNLAMLEAAMDNYIIKYLRQTRQRAFGVEPLIGYILAKEIEIKNLRLLYIGKENMMDEAVLKERLRESYV